MDRNRLVADAAAHPQLFRASGLEPDARGALGLARLPRSQADVHAAAQALATLAGVGLDSAGNVYTADPQRHRIWRWDCAGQGAPLPCLEGPGASPGMLDTPRGVLVTRDGRLLVADSGNDRVQALDLAALQVVGIWPFDRPVDLAEDSVGRLYVSDARGLHQLDRTGRARKAFADAYAAQPVRLRKPGPVAVGGPADDERLLAVDLDGPKVRVYRLDGTYDAAASDAWDRVRAGGIASIAASAQRVYVADSATGQVLVLSPQGVQLGAAAGFTGTVTGLALDCGGRIVVHGAPGEVPVLLAPFGAYAQRGELLVGPLDAGRAVQWHRVDADASGSSATAHLSFFTLTSERPDVPQALPASAAIPGAALTPRDAWRANPADATDVLALNEPARYLWVGIAFDSDGRSTPRLTQLRASFEHAGWLRHLPAVYRDTTGVTAVNRVGAARVTPVLYRLLALFESRLEPYDRAISDLPLLADPAAASESAWLEWLAGWLDLELEPGWDEATRRRAVAEASRRSASRGTRAGLREEIRLRCGVDARIEEAHENASLWSLGETSILGFTTGLAPTRYGGAVLGVSATLGGSHLVDGHDDGAALFEDMAHRVWIEVYAHEVPPERRARLERLLEDEMPAHLEWRLRVIEAAMQVGGQARIGIDTIVGGEPAALRLGEGRLGTSALPALEGERPHGLLGQARLGHDSTLR